MSCPPSLPRANPSAVSRLRTPEEAARMPPVFTDEALQRLRPVAPRLWADRRRTRRRRPRQTGEAFSAKWASIDYESESFRRALARQKAWYLELYGFASEGELAAFLRSCGSVLDAGAGACAKAAWFAELAPETTIVAADVSESLWAAWRRYRGLPNLHFVQCDIADLPFFGSGGFDYVSCDQVIHHTADPEASFRELVRLLPPAGQVAVYVYRRKALPRELLDEHFRELAPTLSEEALWELSRQVTELGRVLSQVEGEIEVPCIPLLGIEGGRSSVQRFLYWNFLKCFWNPELGAGTSVRTNFDWYAPSQAARYSEAEFRAWIRCAGLEELHFHALPSSWSGRFRRPAPPGPAARLSR